MSYPREADIYPEYEVIPHDIQSYEQYIEYKQRKQREEDEEFFLISMMNQIHA